jgi:CHAT domain-containing protein
MDRLKEANAELARLALDGRDADGQNRCERIATLEGRRDAIERDLSERSAAFRSQNRRVTLDAVQTAIPEDAALIEFAVFRPFDPAAEANAVAYGAPRYAAYVIRRNRAPVGVDLGSAVAIERAIAQFRSALRDPTRRDVKERARTLDERVLRPLRASLEGATRLLISPDGDLNLVPFEALVDEHGHYLIEQYTASYLTSGRDLLRAGVAPGRATAAAVILANPQFSPTVGRRAAPASPPTRSAADVDVSSLYFAPLKATAAEALAIRNLFPGAALLTGSRATKGNLEAISGPRILHIASHGFFLADATGGTGASGNPLLRSGLALAGANVERSAGLMTALEASGLDLWGTELVTLSACDTGVGEVRTGDGVYGLRRAFVLAGAQAVVMSLWPVRDDVARDTMVAYYQRLRAGGGRGDALRDAKLAILRNATTRHPYFWAAFIQSGDSRPLSGG